MANHENAPDNQRDDWGGRFQPMTPITDAETEKKQSPPTRPRQMAVPSRAKHLKRQARRRLRSRSKWQLALIALFSPLVLCMGGLLLYVLFPPPPANILLLGLDARTGEGYATRTDAIMLLGVQPRRLRVSALSIPRDLFIDVPGYGSQRINTVNVLGELEESGYGPALLGDGLAESLGVRPTYHMRLNFDAFVQLVDAVGGIRVDIPRLIVDNSYPTRDYGTRSVRFEPGVQHLDGEMALAYARTRHTDDDYGRAERQQQVVRALMRKLVNPLNWGAVVVVGSQNMDTNMNPIQMMFYAPPMVFSGVTGTFDRLVIDRDYIVGGTNGAIPNYEKLRPWIEPRFR